MASISDVSQLHSEQSIGQSVTSIVAGATARKKEDKGIICHFNGKQVVTEDDCGVWIWIHFVKSRCQLL